MPKVSSRCASKLGGSAGTTKISSPPERGFSWARAGVTKPNVTTRARNVRRWLMSGTISSLSHERSAGRHPGRRRHQQSGGSLLRPDAGVAGGGRDQGRGAGQGRSGAPRLERSAESRQPLLPLVQRQQAEPDAQSEEPQGERRLSRSAQDRRRR